MKSQSRYRSNLPQIDERDWLVVTEVANILLNTGIIHRDSENKYGETETIGVQQTRKYIRNGELKGNLINGAKKHGYIIKKKDLKDFIDTKREPMIELYKEVLEKLEKSNKIELLEEKEKE